MPYQPARGDTLTHFCTYHNFIISNTFGNSNFDNAWTHRNRPSRKQLDYILTDHRLSKYEKSSVILERLDIGSDHRAIVISFEFLRTRQQTKCKKARCKPRWHRSVEYPKVVAQEVASLPAPSGDISSRASFLEDAMLKATAACAELAKEKTKTARDATRFSEMMRFRRAAKVSPSLSCDEKRVARISFRKDIQKAIRKDRSLQKNLQMSRPLPGWKSRSPWESWRERARKPSLKFSFLVGSCAANAQRLLAHLLDSTKTCTNLIQMHSPMLILKDPQALYRRSRCTNGSLRLRK